MLFRHMFYCKHVERLLCNVWISNKDFRQYSLHSAKWWAATNLRWLPVKVSTSRTFLPFVLTTCVQVRCRVRPPTANAQLCAEHSVLHDVWGDGAHLARHGEQPENGEWLKKDPWGALRRRRAGFRENVILSYFSFLLSAGFKHRWCALSSHQLPGQLPKGLHADQPRAAQDLLQAHVCLRHVHKLHAGISTTA